MTQTATKGTVPNVIVFGKTVTLGTVPNVLLVHESLD